MRKPVNNTSNPTATGKSPPLPRGGRLHLELLFCICRKMHNDGENENIIQVMGNRNLDEMRQQTLDALKVVQSFEVKPARSARVQELLAQKAQARQFASVPTANRGLSSVRSSAMRAQPPTAERPMRHALQPVQENASPEKRFASSPKKVTSAANSPARSPLCGKSGRTREASPVKTLFAKRPKRTPSSSATDALPLSTTKPGLILSSADASRPTVQESSALAKPPVALNLRTTATQSTTREPTLVRPSTQSSYHASRRGPLVSSSFRPVSRLLQPTAASAAKMRPVRAAMAPVRTERPFFIDQNLSRADTGMFARPTTTASASRPSAFVSKSLAPANATASKSSEAHPVLKHPSRMAGLSQLNTSHNKVGAVPPKFDTRPATTTATTTTADTATAVIPGPPPKSLLSSVLTKTHNEKRPSNQTKTPTNSLPETPNAPKCVAPSQLLASNPCILGPEQSPAITSTPVRLNSNISASEHSSGSFHSFDFTNFSFEAEWVKTPELRKKVLEQKNDDTVQLFGHMPPINLESIFGAEMKRQRR